MRRDREQGDGDRNTHRSRRAARSTLRLFVALYPPDAVARALLAALDHQQLPPHRATPLDHVHVTAHFIGEIDERQLATVVESITSAASGIAAFALQPLHLTPLPLTGPARLVAALTDAPSALHELHDRLVSRLAAGRRPSDRFLPHLTLARFQTPAPIDLATPLVHIAPFTIDAVHLMQSHIGANEVQHRGLARIPLATS